MNINLLKSLILIMVLITGFTYSAEIKGTVTDMEGNPLQNAEIMIFHNWYDSLDWKGFSEESKNMKNNIVLTNENGVYTFEDIEVGSYYAAASKDGYNMIWYDGIEMNNSDEWNEDDLTSIEITSEDMVVEEIDFSLPKIEGGEIFGNVLNEDGDPLNGFVIVYKKEYDSNGNNFDFGNIVEYAQVFEGEYQVYGLPYNEELVVFCEGFGSDDNSAYNWTVYEPEYYDNKENFEDADIIVLTEENSIAENIDFELKPYWFYGNSTISGQITNSDGEPLWAFVHAVNLDHQDNEDGWIFPYHGTTDENGNYELENIAEGNYIIYAISSFEYYKTYYGDVTDSEEASEFQVSEDEDVTDINIVMQKKSTNIVSGYVLDQETNEPIADAEVQVLLGTDPSIYSDDNSFGGKDSTNYNFWWSTTTNETGYYELTLYEGWYGIYSYKLSDSFYGFEYNLEYFKEKTNSMEADPVHVTEDGLFMYDENGNEIEVSSADFTLTYNDNDLDNSISGTVFFDDEPLINSQCTVIGFATSDDWANGGLHIAASIVDSAGNYILNNLFSSEYIIMVVPDWEISPPMYYEDVFNWVDATPVFAEGDIAGIDFHLTEVEPSYGLNQVNGSVIDENNSPLSGTTIYAYNNAGEIAGYYVTNSTGKYNIEGLIPGSYTITAEKMMYESESQSVIFTEANYSMNNMDFSLELSSPTSINEEIIPVRAVMLKNNYPNPFNPRTTISFDVNKDTEIEIAIYDISGKLVKILEKENYKIGSYQTEWNGTNLYNEQVSSGIYFVHLRGGGIESTKKIMMLK